MAAAVVLSSQTSAQAEPSLAVDVVTDGNSSTSLGVTDACRSVDVGETFSIDITVENVTDLAAFEATMIYDQSILEVVATDAKMFLASEPFSSLTVLSEVILPGSFFPTGAWFIGAADKNTGATESGSGVLARITFKAIAPGVSEASIPQRDLDENGTADVGPRLLGSGGESDPISDVNSDGFFDGPVMHASVAVGEECSPGAPVSTQPPTPGPTPAPPTVAPPTEAPSPTTTPAPTAAPPPPAVGGPGPVVLVQGDVDCNGATNSVDALKELQKTAGLPFEQEPSCPGIGDVLPAAQPAGEPPAVFGDVDCDGDVDAVDGLKVLQFVAALPFNQSEPCTDIGDPL